MKHEIVQVKNPRTSRYVKADKTLGRIIARKKTEGAYKNIPIVPLSGNPILLGKKMFHRILTNL